MLSLNNVASTGGALHYFSKDNYYTLDEGLEKSEWFGAGAAALGFVGQVEREEFFSALSGQVGGVTLGRVTTDPDTGEQRRQHRPGIDLTFSAPKSVSLLAEVGGLSDVREAHEAAVRQALAYVEAELAATRAMVEGQVQPIKTGNLVVAMFRHNTSRELDPQTHTHAVIMNATRRPDGEWRSLTNESLYREQRAIGAVYTSALARNLQELGYELERTDDKGNFEITGVSREHVEEFSQRRAQILDLLKSKGIALESATAQQKEDATLDSRSHKKDVDHAALIEAWRSKAVSLGVDLEGIGAGAKARVAAGLADGRPTMTGRQALEFAAAHLIEREAVVTRNDLLAAALEHGSVRVNAQDVLSEFAKLQESGDLIAVGDGEYTTRKMLGSELWALEAVRKGVGETPSILEPHTAKARVEQQERDQGFSYSPGQRAAIELPLTSSDRFVEVQGLAGTGKTTMLRGLRTLAEAEGYVVRGMAPTGAAAKQLSRETGMAADTVSMFVIKESQLQKDIAFARQYAEFERKAELWVVDESSFLSQRQKATVDSLAQRAGAKVVYLGDVLQLQGVEAGKPFELAQRDGIATAMMTEINRQKTPALKQAVSIIVGQDRPGAQVDGRQTGAAGLTLANNRRAFDYLTASGKVQVSKDPLSRMAEAYVSAAPEQRAGLLIITPYNKDRRAVNGQIRAGLKEKGELPVKDEEQQILVSKGMTRAQLKEAQYYKTGDVVRIGRDYASLGVKKGEYFTVAKVDQAAGVVTLKLGDRQVEWSPKKHNKVEAYQVERRELAAGDLIRLTRTEGELKNGEVGRVVELAGNNAILETAQGEHSVRHTLDLAVSRHWDYAYASTIHAAQGATKEAVLFHIPTSQVNADVDRGNTVDQLAKVFGQRSFYVGATRASHELTVYTDDLAGAAKLVTKPQDKTSGAEKLRYVEILQR